VTGFIRCCVFTLLPADPPVHPAKIPPKSLFPNILPVTPLFPISYSGNLSYLQQNKDLWGEGGEGYTAILSPVLELRRSPELSTVELLQIPPIRSHSNINLQRPTRGEAGHKRANHRSAKR